MQIMEYLHRSTDEEIHPGWSGVECFRGKAENGRAIELHGPPAWQHSGAKWNDAGAPWRAGEFYKSLSPQAMSQFESLAAPFCCEGDTVLFTEEEQPCSILFLLEGRVKLSLNSVVGKRLILGSAGPGDILGLTSAVSGCPYEMTAEAQFPCRLISLPRQSFLDFLLCYPVAYRNVARKLSLEYRQACERLRILGFTFSAPAKLARLLLEWCAEGQHTERGIRIRCSLTHGEIGEYIGLSRETVTRTLNDFKNRELVEQHGSTLVVSSVRALEIYTGAC